MKVKADFCIVQKKPIVIDSFSSVYTIGSILNLSTLFIFLIYIIFHQKQYKIELKIKIDIIINNLSLKDFLL